MARINDEMIMESCLLCIFTFDAVLLLFVGYKIPCLLFCSINCIYELKAPMRYYSRNGSPFIFVLIEMY